jgi:hypothetical protein
MSLLDDHVAALRALGDADDDRAASATRLRVRDSLAQDHGMRRQLISAAAALAILFAGTVSWALVTGNLTKLWTAVRERAEITVMRELPPPISQVAPVKTPAPVQRAVDHEEPLVTWEPPKTSEVSPPPPPPPPPTVEPAKPRSQPVTVPAPQPSPIEVLYRKAHDLHFHANDYAAALFAWDDYLRLEPSGRFAVEARYNRALCLVRLGRFADARAALLPFARGEVEPAGYRKDEATAIVDRIGE